VAYLPSGPMLKWFNSYLCGSTQQIKIGSSISTSINVTSAGVPQGGHLSPLLLTTPKDNWK